MLLTCIHSLKRRLCTSQHLAVPQPSAGQRSGGDSEHVLSSPCCPCAEQDLWLRLVTWGREAVTGNLAKRKEGPPSL